MELRPAQYIAQTNANVTFNARVLDGNGAPVVNTQVFFTNLSSPFGTLSASSAVTNGLGIATVNLWSSSPGFATVLAQVNVGSGQVRDRKTVYFTSRDVLTVSLDLDVESVPANESPVVYNDIHDITLFESSTDDTVEVRATVRDAGGVAVDGTSVAWSSSHTEASFLRTETTTNTNGQAKAIVQVTPASIRNTETHVNIFAVAGNGAANMTTLFLNPVTIDTTASYLTANPTVVNINGTSTITAVVKLNTGANAPNGTVVNFTTTCGTVTPFAQTTSGSATATFTAPSTVPTGGACTITGKVGGTTVGTVAVTVTTTLTIQPTAQTVRGSSTATFTIYGGVSSYTVTSSHPSIASPSVSGTTITVTTTAVTTSTAVTITVRDAVGSTASAILTVTPQTPGNQLAVSPSSTTVSCTGTPAITFIVTGGSAPYTITASDSRVTILPNPPVVIADGGSFTATPAVCNSWPDTSSTIVTITVRDSVSSTITATLTVTKP
jgi:hypothetical protein